MRVGKISNRLHKNPLRNNRSRYYEVDNAGDVDVISMLRLICCEIEARPKPADVVVMVVAKSKRDPNPQMVVMVLMDFDGNEIGKGAECFRRFFGGSVYVAICNEE